MENGLKWNVACVTGVRREGKGDFGRTRSARGFSLKCCLEPKFPTPSPLWTPATQAKRKAGEWVIQKSRQSSQHLQVNKDFGAFRKGLAALGRTEYVPETHANPMKVRRAFCRGGMGGKPGLLLCPKHIALDPLCLTFLLFNAACLQSRIKCGNIIKRRKSRWKRPPIALSPWDENSTISTH